MDITAVPDGQSLDFAVQKCEAKNPDVYGEGFQRLRGWCASIPEWVCEQAAVKDSRTLLDFVLQLLHQTDINKGHRSGEACRCLMTIAQSHTGREMLVTRTDEMFPSMMKLLKARNGEEQATLVHVAQCVQSLAANMKMKEQLRKSGATQLLLKLLAVDDDFVVANQALGALMNLANTKAGLTTLARSDGETAIRELVERLNGVEELTVFHRAVYARARFLQVNMSINDPDDLINFKLVDPALTASPLIQHPTSLAESEALQAEATEQEYVEAVKVAIKDMQIGAERIATSEKQSGRHSRKANADGGWGTAYKKYFNQHTK